MLRDLFSRLLGAAAVALSGLLPEGVTPGSSEEAFSLAALLAVYGVVHVLTERGTGGSSSNP